ncbi:MAG: T9SS type A sorting domain-containing protein [Flavobacteriales bacterium]|jgi:hypothetical protein
MKKILIALFTLVVSSVAAQIYEPEGLNMPGAWNGWTNLPTNNLALANPNQVPGGRLVKITQGQARWQTIFSVGASGADLVGGSYEFVFSSGPSGSPWNNTWKNSTFSMNTITGLTFNSGANNSITISNGKWYTMNWIDAGYTNNQAIFMETSAEPVALSSASQSPTNGNVENTDAVTVTVTASAAPSAEELVYVRYSTDAFATSTLAAVTFTGTSGTATIPAQAAATTVQYYIFSTTVTSPDAADIDKVTIRTLTNSGANFNYTVNSPLPPVNITFQVDMNQVTIDPSGVFIAGSFNGFSNQVMTSVGGGIYEYTASLAQGASVQYKFKNGTNGWEGNIGAPCGDGSNRTYTVGAANASADLVCFNSCAACPATYNVTFRVNMSSETVGGDVYINGNFPPANWSTPQVMTNAGGGIYTYTATLGAGNNYEYKFINGSNYEGNLSAPCGNGSNRTITVPSANTTLPVACFSYCGNCTTNNVTFRVDMSQQTVDPSGVFIAGSFNGFSNAAMTDAGNGIYTYSLNLQQGTSVSYKYKNGTDGWEGNIGAPCGDGSNRVLNVSGASSSVLAVNCFNSCGSCPQFHNMTFAVSMANVLVSPNGVHLAGGFGAYGYANWNPSGIAMTDPDGNGVYTVTLSLPAGQSFEYKFINGNDWPGAEGVPAECNTFSNRTFTVMGYDGLVGGAPICFGGCGACSASVSNDSPYSAVVMQYNTNMNYPNCYPLSGNTTSANDSPQSSAYNGKDVWYRFVAQSAAVSITMNSSSQDDVISVYEKSGETFSLVSGGSENAASGISDLERLNLTGLTVGQTYYVSVGSLDATGGAFQLCLQHLMPGNCSTIVPVGGLNLCDVVRSAYRGSPSQGVTYTFNFTPTGATAGSATAVSGTNGLLVLSNTTAALRYAGTYGSTVDVRYGLTDGAGTPEVVDITGSAIGGCASLTIRTQPNLEVRSSQRCNASLLRSNWLIGNPVVGEPRICGATSYSYEFTQVVSCADPTVVSVVPSVYTTTSASPYLPLGVLTSLPNTGAWRVRIRPNFSYGDGVFGAPQTIQVVGTASMELEEGAMMSEKSAEEVLEFGVYPNPSNGEYVELNLQDLESGAVQIRVLDAAGRVVHTGNFATDGNLRTTLNFSSSLNPGVYMIDILNNGIARTERLVVQQ